MPLLRRLYPLLLFALLCAVASTARAAELQTISASQLKHRIAERSGKPLILVYWASWCGPCRHYKEKLAAMLTAYPDRPFDMLAVALDTDAQRVEAYLARVPLPYPVALADSSLLAELGGTPIPTTVLYHSDGTEARKFSGDATQKRLDHFVHKLLEQEAATSATATRADGASD